MGHGPSLVGGTRSRCHQSQDSKEGPGSREYFLVRSTRYAMHKIGWDVPFLTSESCCVERLTRWLSFSSEGERCRDTERVQASKVSRVFKNEATKRKTFSMTEKARETVDRRNSRMVVGAQPSCSLAVNEGTSKYVPPKKRTDEDETEHTQGRTNGEKKGFLCDVGDVQLSREQREREGGILSQTLGLNGEQAICDLGDGLMNGEIQGEIEIGLVPELTRAWGRKKAKKERRMGQGRCDRPFF
jgi:hypothetical protein